MDLETVNGTFLNGERVESLRYYELMAQVWRVEKHITECSVGWLYACGTVTGCEKAQHEICRVRRGPRYLSFCVLGNVCA
jgi:hypothetical protein